MKEVWFVNQYAIPPDLPGGTRHYDLGLEMNRAGRQVRIFTSNVNLATRQHIRDLRGKLYWEEELNGVRFTWIKTNIYQRNDWRRVLNMLNFSCNVYRAGLKINARPVVIIGSSPNLFAALAGLKLAQKIGCRYMLEIRDLWPQTLIDMENRRESEPVIKVLRHIEKHLYRQAEHIIVLAEGSIPYLRNMGVPRERITFLPNGVHTRQFVSRLNRDEARRRFKFDRFTVVYTGAHGPANSLHTLLEAAHKLRNETGLEIVLVGDGSCKKDLQNLALHLELPNVRFMDPVSKKQIPDLLSAADAAVITLKNAQVFNYGISPNKLFDYMAAGKPVLCASPGDMAKMVVETGCGVAVPPEDSTALALAIKQMSALPTAFLDEMGRRGHSLVLKRFSRDKLAYKLLELIS